jgi:hypothetical protein
VKADAWIAENAADFGQTDPNVNHMVFERPSESVADSSVASFFFNILAARIWQTKQASHRFF